MSPSIPERDIRERETETQAWRESTPQVSASSVCSAPERCAGGFGVDWDERDRYIELGEVPTTLDAARALVARAFCDECGRPHAVHYLSVFAPEAAGGSELMRWTAEE